MVHSIRQVSYVDVFACSLPQTRARTVVVVPATGSVLTVHVAKSGVIRRENSPAFDAARYAGKQVEPVRSVWPQFKPFQVEGLIEQDVGGGKAEGWGCPLQTKNGQSEYGKWQ